MVTGGFWSVAPLSAQGRFPELDTDDVPASFLENWGIIPPVPAVPLSELGIFFSVEFAPGAQVATVSMPIAQDATQEAAEGVVPYLDGFGDPVVPQPLELTGLVPANSS
jgi:hypothetical protein